MAGISTSSDAPERNGARGVRRGLVAAALLVFTIAIGPSCARMLIGSGWFRAPFPPLTKELAWQLGDPEPAYNVGIVDDTVFRSSKPDERFLRWVRDHYGIQHVIGLAGPIPAHDEARRLGMRVSVYAWRVSELPPAAELREVLAALRSGERVLLHCASGADRTGYTVAALRVQDQQWPIERAVEEMRRYSHDPARWPRVHAELRRFLSTTPVAAQP